MKNFKTIAMVLTIVAALSAAAPASFACGDGMDKDGDKAASAEA